MPSPVVSPAHRRVVRLTSTMCVAAALTGCGSPPQPLPTSPPESPPSLGAGASGGPSAGAVVPFPPAGQPPLPGSTALPGAPVYPAPVYPAPVYPAPTYPAPPPVATMTTTPAPPRPTRSLPPPAPKCTKGPTAAQVLATLEGRPGVPDRQQLRIDRGPLCAGDWQYSAVRLLTEPDAEPLLVITRGTPPALRLVEAGADVCSEAVERTAPPGIRVLACGT